MKPLHLTTTALAVLAGCTTPPDNVERIYLCSGGRVAAVSFSGNTARIRFQGGEAFDVWLRSASSGTYSGARAVLQAKGDEALIAIDGRELGPCQEVKPKP